MPDDAIVTSDADNNEDDASRTAKEEEVEEDEIVSGSDPDAWATNNWESRENAEESEDFRWWIHSSTTRMHSLPLTEFLWTLFSMAFTSRMY